MIKIEGGHFGKRCCKFVDMGIFPHNADCIEYPIFWIYQKNYWIEIYRRIRNRIRWAFSSSSPNVKIEVQRAILPTYKIPDKPIVPYSKIFIKRSSKDEKE